MAIFRITHTNFEQIFDVLAGQADTLHENEWENTDRIFEDAWIKRFEYEASIVLELIKDNNIKSILEIGAGPGSLSQLIQRDVEVEYHLIDKPFAKKFFEEHNYKGKFFVKDISIDLDLMDLNEKYDLIICNDVLEHLLAPSLVLSKIHKLMKDDSMFLISVPNWRMSHQFIYRGVWDYDNFVYLLYTHELEPISVYPSILQTPFYEKLDSEESMPDELITSWNFYFIGKKRK